MSMFHGRSTIDIDSRVKKYAMTRNISLMAYLAIPIAGIRQKKNYISSSPR